MNNSIRAADSNNTSAVLDFYKAKNFYGYIAKHDSM